MIKQTNSAMVREQVYVVGLNSWSSTLDEVETRRRARDQIRAVTRVVPSLDDGAETKISRRDPVTDAC